MPGGRPQLGEPRHRLSDLRIEMSHHPLGISDHIQTLSSGHRLNRHVRRRKNLTKLQEELLFDHMFTISKDG
jgi:hypothetical protein